MPKKSILPTQQKTECNGRNDPKELLLPFGVFFNLVNPTKCVLGAPVPNYSNIVLTGPSVYLYTILFIDLKTVEYYENDMQRVTNEVVKLVRESNKYFYQLNIRIVVVDVIPTNRHDLSLYSFEDFHNRLNGQLPYHDFAVLVKFQYAGGLAFVSGFCSNKNVMMVGVGYLVYAINVIFSSIRIIHKQCPRFSFMKPAI
jgi:hypothetical protein